MNLKEATEQLNIDYNATLNYFGENEEIYKRFLKKFLDDNTYCELEEAWKDGDYNRIEKKAHTLKGVSGNLKLNNLYTISNDLVQKIRMGEYEKTQEIYSKLVDIYEFTVETIRNID